MQNPAAEFWLGKRLYRAHSVAYGSAVVLWAAAAAFAPGDWSLFWPVMIWTIAYMIHFLIFKSVHADEEWIENRAERVNDEAKDLSHIEAIRGDYTGAGRLRRPKRGERPDA